MSEAKSLKVEYIPETTPTPPMLHVPAPEVGILKPHAPLTP